MVQLALASTIPWANRSAVGCRVFNLAHWPRPMPEWQNPESNSQKIETRPRKIASAYTDVVVFDELFIVSKDQAEG